jgi:hypothetical protein
VSISVHAVVAYFKAISWNSPGTTEETHRKPGDSFYLRQVRFWVPPRTIQHIGLSQPALSYNGSGIWYQQLIRKLTIVKFSVYISLWFVF